MFTIQTLWNHYLEQPITHRLYWSIYPWEKHVSYNQYSISHTLCREYLNSDSVVDGILVLFSVVGVVGVWGWRWGLLRGLVTLCNVSGESSFSTIGHVTWWYRTREVFWFIFYSAVVTHRVRYTCDGFFSSRFRISYCIPSLGKLIRVHARWAA